MKRSDISSKTNSMAKHAMLGIVIALASAFLLSIVIAVLVGKEIMNIDWIPVLVWVTNCLSVFLGSIVSIGIEKGRAAVLSAIVSAGYATVLICVNMLVYSTGFSEVLGGVLSICAGGVISAIVYSWRLGRKNTHRKRRYR